MFVVSDELHDESAGQFQSLEEAVTWISQLAMIAWDDEPNRAPCTSWRTCGRTYMIVEFDDSARPWREIRSIEAVEIDASGVKWADTFPPQWRREPSAQDDR